MSDAHRLMYFESPAAWRSHALFQEISRQNACLCRTDMQLLTDELLAFINPVVPQVATHECFDDVLLQCSLLEKLCILHLQQIHDGHICSSVKKMLDVLINARVDVKDFLLKYLASGNQYVNYAACKALVRFIESVKLATGSTYFIVELDNHFSTKLVKGNLLLASSLLTVIEHTCFVTAEKWPQSLHLKAKDHCCLVAVKPTMEPQIDYFWHNSISQAIPSLMTQISSTDKVFQSQEAVECLSQMLRIMLFRVQSDCHLQEILSHTVPSLLLASSTSLLVSSCEILHKVFNSFDTSNESNFTNPMLLTLCKRILTVLTTLIDKSPTSGQESTLMRGFGGNFHLGDRNHVWSYSEFQNGDHLETQTIILLYLSSLKFLSMHCFPQTDNHDLLSKSVSSLQTFCGKNSSLTWKSSPSFRCSYYLVSLFGDQDDALIEALDHSLEIVSRLKRNGYGDEDRICQFWNPHSEIYFFLQSIGLDYNVVLDLLMANDTCFLSYFVKYLKLASRDVEQVWTTHQELSHNLTCEKSWHVMGKPSNVRKSIVQMESKKNSGDSHRILVEYDSSEEDVSSDSASSGQQLSVAFSKDFSMSRKKALLSLDQLVHFCSSLCFCVEKQLRKKLFPYNAKPLVKLLQAFISLYNRTE